MSIRITYILNRHQTPAGARLGLQFDYPDKRNRGVALEGPDFKIEVHAHGWKHRIIEQKRGRANRIGILE